ncbi:hypothetical protein V493_00083 [Pseudogymnoascus sp. VKM F-4281 (FW-2241)]|nr:hypothetical protein V493_00083 [Pseudogymnoascus sp. VKM F-4281 (FW-2241)]
MSYYPDFWTSFDSWFPGFNFSEFFDPSYPPFVTAGYPPPYPPSYPPGYPPSYPPSQSPSYPPPQDGYEDGWDGPPGTGGGNGGREDGGGNDAGEYGGLPPFKQDQPQGDQSIGRGNYIQFFADHEPDLINTSQLDGLPFFIRRSSTGKGKDVQGKQKLDISKLPWSRRIEAMALQAKATGGERNAGVVRGRCTRASFRGGAAAPRPQRTLAQEASAKAAMGRAPIPVRSRSAPSPMSKHKPGTLGTLGTATRARTGVVARGFDAAGSSRSLGNVTTSRGFDAGRTMRNAAADAAARRDAATKGEQERKKRALKEEELRKAWEKKNQKLIAKEKAEREKREMERQDRARLERRREARERRARDEKERAAFAREKAAEAAGRRDEGSKVAQLRRGEQLRREEERERRKKAIREREMLERAAEEKLVRDRESRDRREREDKVKTEKARRAAAEAAGKRDEGSRARQGKEREKQREEAARWEREKADLVQEARQRAAEERARVEREGAQKLVRDREGRERREREVRDKTREVRSVAAEAAERRRMEGERARREDESKANKEAKIKAGKAVSRDPPSSARAPEKPPTITQKQPAKPAIKSAPASAPAKKPNVTFAEPIETKPEPEPDQPLIPREAVAAAARRREEAARKQQAEEGKEAAKAAKTAKPAKPTARPAPKITAAVSKPSSSKSAPAPKPTLPKQAAIEDKPKTAAKTSAPRKPAPEVSKTKPHNPQPSDPSNPRSAAAAAAAARLEAAAKQKREDEIKEIEKRTGKPTWDFGGLDGKGGVAYIAGDGARGKLSTLNGSSTRETLKKTRGWSIFGAGEGAKNPLLYISHLPTTNGLPPLSYSYKTTPSTRAFTSSNGVSAALPRSLASSLHDNPPTSPEELLESLENAAERGIPLSEPGTRGSGMGGEGGGELRRGGEKKRNVREAVIERTEFIGTAHPPLRHVSHGEWSGAENEGDGYRFRPVPRLKRRREAIDLGLLPSRLGEVDERLDLGSEEERKRKNKGKGKGKQRGMGLFGWLGS